MLLANLLLAAVNVVPVPALDAPVAIAVDDRGIPAIEAASRLDAFAAEGFVHARDRLFQMDLMRRNAAGELAALLGGAVVDRDLDARPRRFRALSKRILANLSDDERLQLSRYASGVNAAIASMRTPPEYAFLGWPPAPWLPEDSILVSLSMHSMLARSADLERGWHDWRECLGEAMFEFLLCPTSRFDALLIEDFDTHGLDRPAPIPGPDVIDLRAAASAPSDHLAASIDFEVDLAPIPGSNAFAVSGALTADGRAILASDPHLALSMPTTWYRLALEWPSGELTGLSLPGLPGVVIGSNGRVAWGFTNLTGDFEDWILVETKPGDDGRYLVPGGSEPFGEMVERIDVRGEKPQDLVLRSTRWGPVLAEDRLGRPLVLRSAIDEPASTNLAILDLHAARSIDDALATLARWNNAPQNAIVADDSGRIGWVVTGFLPDRGGADGRTARSLAAGGDAWTGPLPESRRPRIADPESGFLFTANARAVPLSWSSQFGSQWAEPTRAHRIRALLERGNGSDGFDEPSMLAIQLDTTVESLEPWRELVLGTVPTNATGSLAALREIAEGWNGRAEESERGPVVLEAVRRRVIESMLAPILAVASARCAEAPPSQRFRVVSDEPWLRLLEARPDHFLPRRHRTWDDFLLAQIREAAAAPELRL
ncbi:MAG: penicillin acylase family protein, partial [Phycisphaerales bacterium]